MDLNTIAETIQQNISGNGLNFCDSTVGVPYITKLFYYHMSGKDSFQMTDVKCETDAQSVSLSGNATLPDGTQCSPEMVFTVTDGNLRVDMKEQLLLDFGGVALSAAFSYGQDMWMVSFAAGQDVSFADLFAGGIAFLGIDVPKEIFGNAGELSSLKMQFELPFQETSAIEPLSADDDDYDYGSLNLENYLSLSFETNVSVDLSGLFQGGENVGLTITSFSLEKFWEEYGFSFGGEIKLWSMDIPFMMRYDESGFLFSMTKGKGDTFGIPSINEMGKIIGMDQLNFPESLSSLTEFELTGLTLRISPDFSGVSDFSVVVSNPNQWVICQEPALSVRNINAGFSKTFMGDTVFAGGEINIGRWSVTLASAYQTDAGWIFRAYLENDCDTPLDIEDLFAELCEFLGFPKIPFLLPRLDFIGAMFSYNSSSGDCCVEIDFDRLTGSFRYAFSPEKSYALDLKVDYEIALKDLPIVGKDLHLLDDAVIRNIEFSSDSDSTMLSLEFAREQLQVNMGGKNAGLSAEAEAQSSTVYWINLEQRFSIFTLHRIGIGLAGKEISFAVDAELNTGSLSLGVSGMGVSLEMGRRPDPAFALSGLSVDFQSPMVQIGGGFRHTVTENGDSYAGNLTLGIKTLMVLLAGSYSENSFLAYGLLKAGIGGPPAFTVTGLAAGFGWNKSLKLPAIGEVESFPLVAAAMDKLSMEELTDAMNGWMAVGAGQEFLAAGVRFQSFGMLDSFALLTVSFGKNSEVAVLGLSEMTVPPRTEEDPIAKAVLELKAALLPSSGLFSVEAQLTGDSYILSRQCVLTGGFACYLWYDGPHKGDFVVTLGGYKSGYVKPDHYPDVPRVGFCWNISSELTMSGEMYFALTPAMLYAGGKLNAVFHKGALRAWFTAYADIGIGWKPFYYEMEIGASLGASITLKCWLFSKTFTLEMAADLQIHGPEFSGKARIKWWVISFTISFGSGQESAKTVSWDEFKQSFLSDNIFSIQAAEGKIGTIRETEQGPEIDVLHGDTAQILVESLIPNSGTVVNGVSRKENEIVPLGVAPMGNTTLDSPLTVTVSQNVGGNGTTALQDCETESVTRNVPKAMWERKGTEAAADQESLIQDVVTGTSVRFQSSQSGMFPEQSFLTLDMLSEYEKEELQFQFTDIMIPDIEKADEDFAVFQGAADGIRTKAAVFSEQMKKEGFTFSFTPDLSVMAADARSLFDEEIMISGGESHGAVG